MIRPAKRFLPLSFILLGLLVLDLPNLVAQQNWPAAIKGLQQQLRSSPRDKNLRAQLAAAHYNYANVLGHQKKWKEATSQMEEALKLDRQNTDFKKNLSMIQLNHANQLYKEPTPERPYRSYRHLEAKKILEKALRLNPRLAFAYLLLGDIEYDNQKLPMAKLNWEKAKRLDPNLNGLASRLDRVGRESQVESNMKSVADSYFTLRYDDSVQQSAGVDIRGVLREARQNVGRDFRYRPNHKIVVLLYSREAFQKIRARAPEWASAYYDGKIRVTMPRSQQDLRSVKKTVVHEYTHAVVHDLSQRRIPAWFNEGLAEYQEAKYANSSMQASPLKQALANDQLVPWNQIQSLFRSDSISDVRMGYDQAHSVVAYLAQRYGFRHMPALLKLVAQGVPFEEALEKEFKNTPERLERDWKRWLPRFF